MARRWLIVFFTFVAVLALLTTSSNTRSSVFDMLVGYMNERYDNWRDLSDRDVTDDVCPLVTVALLDEISRYKPNAIKTGLVRPLANVPLDSTYWIIVRGAPGWFDFRTITLMILTNQDYCRALYYVRMF